MVKSENPDIGCEMQLQDIEATQYQKQVLIGHTPGKAQNEFLRGYEKTLPRPIEDLDRLGESHKKLMFTSEQSTVQPKFTPAIQMAYYIQQNN